MFQPWAISSISPRVWWHLLCPNWYSEGGLPLTTSCIPLTHISSRCWEIILMMSWKITLVRWIHWQCWRHSAWPCLLHHLCQNLYIAGSFASFRQIQSTSLGCFYVRQTLRFEEIHWSGEVNTCSDLDPQVLVHVCPWKTNQTRLNKSDLTSGQRQIASVV